MKAFAAQPPQYLPGPAYFYLMHNADFFVVADDLQFTTHGLINRTRIKTVQGAQWLTVPVRTHGLGRQQIKDVQIHNAGNWRRRHWKTIVVNYRGAAYFEKYSDAFQAIYEREWTYLADLNSSCIDLIHRELQLPAKLVRGSELGVDATATARIIALAEALGCDTYLCERRFARVIDRTALQNAGIRLVLVDPPEIVFHQLFGAFLPGLSIIDLLFNEGDEAKTLLPGRKAI